jgi:hypothetical protein
MKPREKVTKERASEYHISVAFPFSSITTCKPQQKWDNQWACSGVRVTNTCTPVNVLCMYTAVYLTSDIAIYYEDYHPISWPWTGNEGKFSDDFFLQTIGYFIYLNEFYIQCKSSKTYRPKRYKKVHGVLILSVQSSILVYSVLQNRMSKLEWKIVIYFSPLFIDAILFCW